jgi:hypothetical protein
MLVALHPPALVVPMFAFLQLSLDGHSQQVSPLFTFCQHGINSGQRSFWKPQRRLFVIDLFAAHTCAVSGYHIFRQNLHFSRYHLSHLEDIIYYSKHGKLAANPLYPDP